ncbi:MAG: peptidylprolyl isomerase [Cytophagaceae bacterium]
MKISPNTVVSISYELKVKDQEGNLDLLEKADEQEPMVFLFGQSGLPEKFEKELNGKGAGDGFEFDLNSDEAYGEVDEDAIVRFPIDVFSQNGALDKEVFKVGALIPMSDPDGNMLRGRILDITPNDIEMDFNHPLAGYDLFFKGNITEVREATPEELDHGHVHGSGGHHH